MADVAAEEEVRFAGGAGHDLAAVLRRPDEDTRGGVLLSHCFTCSKDLHTMTRLSRGLAAEGWAVLRFDFTGIGESGGSFRDKTVARNVEDVVVAADVLRERVDGPIGLLGHSMGGAATLLAAHRIPEAACVVVVATPSSPLHLRSALSHVVDEVEREGVVSATIAGRQFPVSAGLLADLERHDQGQRVRELGRPLLVVHPVDDEVVPVEEGERIFAAARQPKGFVPLLDTDHLLSDRPTAMRTVRLVADWLSAVC